MKFSKLSEQQIWHQVQESTRHVLETPDFSSLLEWLRTQGVEPEKSVFPEIGEVDTRTYAGTVISQNRIVFEFYADYSDIDNADLDDVSGELGPKDPKHPEADLHNAITMGLVFFDNR